MTRRPVSGFAGKADLLSARVRDVNVLHLGAVGETCEDTEARVRGAEKSVHALITGLAARCVGVDYDEPSVKALTERGIFDNLLLADVTELTRSEIDLPVIDVIVAGDTIEHLSEPGRLLEVASDLADENTSLILTTPNALGLGLFLKNIMGRELEGDDHVCSFNAYSLGNLVERHGWRLDELWTCYQPRAEEENQRTFRFGKVVLERLPRMGGTLFAVCSRGPRNDP